MIILIKRARCQEAKAWKVQEGLRIEVDHLQKKVVEAERLAEEKVTEIRSLQDILQKEEFVLAEL